MHRRYPVVGSGLAPPARPGMTAKVFTKKAGREARPSSKDMPLAYCGLAGRLGVVGALGEAGASMRGVVELVVLTSRPVEPPS